MTIIKQNVEYTPDLATQGSVTLTIKRLGKEGKETLNFDCIEDMEACAIARPTIPTEVWDAVIEFYKASQAHDNPKFI